MGMAGTLLPTSSFSKLSNISKVCAETTKQVPLRTLVRKPKRMKFSVAWGTQDDPSGVKELLINL